MINLLLLFGGKSSEHEVSLNSARNVFEAIDKGQYNVTLVAITKGGEWRLVDTVREANDTDAAVILDLADGHFYAGSDQLTVDVAFPVLHGKFGEDGTIQGLLELLNIPYVGPTVLGAAVTMNKDMTKRLARDAGVPVVPWRVWNTETKAPSYKEIQNEFGGVVFVKPSRAGSSMGVSRVENAGQWQAAIDLAAQHDTEVLIEKAVTGNEFQVAVLGNATPRATDICEIVIGAKFHDFEDKYNQDSAAQFFIPARLSQATTEQIREWAIRSYKATNCRGMARVDFLADADGQIYLNEINSIPGFTGVSVYPKLWNAAGIGYSQLISNLIKLALQ